MLNFERIAYQFDPAVLVWPGLMMVGAGIVLWLAGLRMSRVCAVVLGSIAGGLIGYSVFPQSRIEGSLFGATIAAVGAFIFDKFIIVLLGSVIVGAILLTVMCSGYLDKIDVRAFPSASQETKLDERQSFSQMAAIVDFCWSGISTVLTSVNKLFMLPAAAVVLILWFLGIFLARFVVAFACSTVGAALIFAGMTWLLLYKGSGPLSFMYQRLWFFMCIFAVMAAGGTVVQLLLCPGIKPVVQQEPIGQEKVKDKVKYV